MNNAETKKIWVKLLEFNNNKYCYDVGTNHLLQVNDVLYDVLSKYDYSNKDELLSKLSSRFSKDKILDTFHTIDDFNKKGGFILQKKIRLRFPFDKNEYKFILDNYLKNLILNITENCNLNCKYCVFSGTYKYHRLHNKHSMDWQIVQRTLDFFIPKCHERLKETQDRISIGFYGGEPLLEWSKILKIVEYTRDKYPGVFPGIDFRITTNGVLLNENIIKELINNKFILTVSLDGPEAIHDRYRVFRDGTGSYDMIIKNLNLIKKYDNNYFREKVNFSVTMAPEYRIYEVVEYFRNEFPDQEISNLFSMVYKYETTFFDNFDMEIENKKCLNQLNSLLIDSINNEINNREDRVLSSIFRDDFKNIHFRSLFSMPDETYPNGCCAPGIKKLFIDTGGRFYTCEKSDIKYPIGDLNNGFNIDAIFRMIDLYCESTNHCEYCWAIRFCNSCFISAMINNKFSKQRKEENCALLREKTLNNLRNYIYLSEIKPEFFNSEYFNPGKDEVTELLKILKKKKVNKKYIQE